MADDQLAELNGQGLALLEKAREMFTPMSQLRGCWDKRRQRVKILAFETTVTGNLITALSWVQERRAASEDKVPLLDAVLPGAQMAFTPVTGDMSFDGADAKTATSWRELERESRVFCARVAELDAALACGTPGQSIHAA